MRHEWKEDGGQRECTNAGCNEAQRMRHGYWWPEVGPVCHGSVPTLPVEVEYIDEQSNR